jgi:hypothetical protein
VTSSAFASSSGMPSVTAQPAMASPLGQPGCVPQGSRHRPFGTIQRV